MKNAIVSPTKDYVARAVQAAGQLISGIATSKTPDDAVKEFKKEIKSIQAAWRLDKYRKY